MAIDDRGCFGVIHSGVFCPARPILSAAGQGLQRKTLRHLGALWRTGQVKEGSRAM